MDTGWEAMHNRRMHAVYIVRLTATFLSPLLAGNSFCKIDGQAMNGRVYYR